MEDSDRFGTKRMMIMYRMIEDIGSEVVGKINDELLAGLDCDVK